ncbi:MAG TPA: CAP domain-containing protein, partial [Thermoanaerobaculia bacterium]|nr:CAP domain-containing protein [Thermoanaerobaculia bacterium]
ISAPREQSGGVSREAILDAMNQEREGRGLPLLRLDPRLNAAANDRIRDMFNKHYFDHVSPDGTQPFVWVQHRSYRYGTVGENLAEGYRSATGVVNGWMNSPGHRRNLLGQSFQDAGIAIVRGSPTGRTNGFTVVAIYAREATRHPSAIVAPSSSRS